MLKALLSAIVLGVEAMQAPDLPFHPWIHQQKGHPGQIAVAAYLLGLLDGSQYTRASGGQSCYHQSLLRHRQMAGPSSIHSVPTEQYNQGVVSLGMHAAVTAMDALECLRNQTAMLLLATAQAWICAAAPPSSAPAHDAFTSRSARSRSSKTAIARWKSRSQWSARRSLRAPSRSTVTARLGLKKPGRAS